MRDYRKDFAPFKGKIWLNAASEGPLPLAGENSRRCPKALVSKADMKKIWVMEGLFCSPLPRLALQTKAFVRRL